MTTPVAALPPTPPASAADEGDDSRPDHGAYRALLSVTNQPGWIHDGAAQLKTWLAEKGFDVDLDATARHTRPDARLTLTRHASKGEEALRAELAEQNDGGGWHTSILLIDGPDPWISIESLSDSGRIVAAPRVAGRFLGVLELADADQVMRAEPLHVASEQQREGLLELLLSDRRGLAIVAENPYGHTSPQGQAFNRKVARLLKWTRGLAHACIVDPDSAQWLIAESRGELRVGAGSIRSFRPGLDLAVDSTLRGHRTMRAEHVSHRSESYLQRMFALFSHATLADRPEPTRVATWRRTLDRLDSRATAQALRERNANVHAAPSRSPELAQLTARTERAEADLARVQAALRVPDLEPSTLAALLARPAAVPAVPEPEERIATLTEALSKAQAKHAQELASVRGHLALPDLEPGTLKGLAERASEVEAAISLADAGADEVDRLAAELEEAQALATKHENDAWAARQDAQDEQANSSRHDARNRRLDAILRQHGLYDAGEDVADPDAPLDEPGSWTELVESFSSWAGLGVVITASPARAMELEDLDVDGRILGRTWQGLRALAGYRRAKVDGKVDGNLERFLSATPNGYAAILPSWHEKGESGWTKQHHGDERTFPCRESVDASGQILMSAHLRLGRVPNKDPRLHLYDATGNPEHGDIGPVVVGYIGVHLTNRSTSKHN